MPFKPLVGQKDEDDSKPLLRPWIKEQKSVGNNPYLQTYPIHSIRMSKSEEWIVIECADFLCLLNAESQLGSQLWIICSQLSGEGNALCIQPKKSGKLGFDVGVDDEVRMFYNFRLNDDNQNELRASFKDVHQKKISGLRIEDIITSPSPTSSVNGSDPTPAVTTRGRGKTAG